MLLAKFVLNGSNGPRGVGKSKFIFFHRALVAHGEVVTWVSCHWDTPMWRCATLCVLSKMYRRLLFNNLSIVWNIKILLTSFLGEVRKSRFAIFREFAEKIGGWKWAWPMSWHSAQFSELVDIAAPSGGIRGRQETMTFFGRCDVYSSFGEFWGMYRQWKMRSFGQKSRHSKIGPSQVEPCSGPNYSLCVSLFTYTVYVYL